MAERGDNAEAFNDAAEERVINEGMSEQINIKDEPVDSEYNRILAAIKPDPDHIPDGFFDDIVNDKELDDIIDNVNDQLEDKKCIIPPPAEVAPIADSSSNSNDYEHCKERIKESDNLLKYKKGKKRERHSSSNNKSTSRKKRRRSSRHSRHKRRSKRRSRSSSDDNDTERVVIQPLKVQRYKEEQAQKQVTAGDAVEENIEKTEETRRERVIQMCNTFVETFPKSGTRPIKTKFLYTPSVIQVIGVDDLLEYRSPLNHITNVKFKFNSPSAYVAVQQFGLKTFTDSVTNVSKEIGLDTSQLMEKLTTTELPKALKPEPTSNTLSKDGKFHTPFFTDVATQTDELEVKTFAERGVMAVPMRAYKRIQTESEQELPIMNTISLLNSSQLLALNNIIRAPAPTHPTDVYRFGEKVLEILNVSQQSCIISNNVTPTIQHSTMKQQRPLPVHDAQSFIPLQTQSQNQYNINNHASISHVSQAHYSGATRQNSNQFFNMGTSVPQNHAFPTQSAHTNMNMQYQYPLQNEQIQHHYPQHNMSQYQPPQPVRAPNVRRDDPRLRGKEIDLNNIPPAPRSNNPSKASSLGRESRNLKSNRR